MGIESVSRSEAKPAHLKSLERAEEKKWVILHCHPKQEEHVAAQLQVDNIKSYIPYFETGKNRKNLLLDYMFVELSEISESLMPKVRRAHGVKDQVMDGDKYAIVSQAIVNVVRDQASKLSTDNSETNNIKADNSLSKELQELKGVLEMPLTPKHKVLAVIDANKNYLNNHGIREAV